MLGVGSFDYFFLVFVCVVSSGSFAVSVNHRNRCQICDLETRALLSLISREEILNESHVYIRTIMVILCVLFSIYFK